MSKTKRFLALVLIVLMLASSLAISASAALEAPAKVTATQSSSVIRLTWSKVSDATGYRIYYKFPRDLHWKTCVSSTTKTTYRFTDLPSGEVYIFGIKSYTKSGSKTTWSEMKKLRTATEPFAPKKLTASQNETSINQA